MRKFKITFSYALNICNRICIRKHNEAKESASHLENLGFPPQLQDNACRKNLEKFKRKKNDSK